MPLSYEKLHAAVNQCKVSKDLWKMPLSFEKCHNVTHKCSYFLQNHVDPYIPISVVRSYRLVSLQSSFWIIKERSFDLHHTDKNRRSNTGW